MDDLLALLNGTDAEAARSAALELGDRRAYGAVPAMLAVLAGTDDAGVRNGVAYALSAMLVPETFGAVVDLLRQERTRGARGTLLHALRPFDCTPVLPLLVDEVIGGTWESCREAAWLISEIPAVDADTWIPLRDRLSAADADAERRETIDFLVGFFTDEED